MLKTTHSQQGGTTYTTGAAEFAPVASPAVALRHNSSHTASLGVHVQGNMSVAPGARGLSLSLDPVLLERKLAVQQIQNELRSTYTSTTTHR
jgi:hypothetical protein